MCLDYHMKYLLIPLLWTMFWGSIGAAIGIATNSHGWQAIPILGGSFGLISGIVFSVLVATLGNLSELKVFTKSLQLSLVSSFVSMLVVAHLAYMELFVAGVLTFGMSVISAVLITKLSQKVL